MDTETTTLPANGATKAEAPLHSEERELVSRLKAIIDRNGRYSYRLDDMAAGFAAGRGVSPVAARMEIEDQFVKTYQRSPKEYMEQRYQEMHKNRSYAQNHSRGMSQ